MTGLWERVSKTGITTRGREGGRGGGKTLGGAPGVLIENVGFHRPRRGIARHLNLPEKNPTIEWGSGRMGLDADSE